jgi:phosphatidyl-myo-inositol dimannoside synthase
MKLLLLTRRYPPREPVATWSFEMARRLAVRCEDFAVCGFGAGASELGHRGLGFELLRPPPSVTRPTSIAAWGLASARARRFDVVLGSDWVPASLGLAWRGRSRIRRVFAAVHGPELDWQRAASALGGLYRRTAELVLGRVDAVFATSGQAQARIASLHLQRSELVGRACDPERFHPAPRGMLAHDLGVIDRRVLLSVGHLVPERRIDKVLFAVSALGVRYPDLCCVISGEGPERQRLELLAERLRIAHKVRFLGGVDADRLPEVYQLCDVFVHLSGGLRDVPNLDGSALIEALASGKPAIVTARAADIEGIDDRTVSIVPEDDSSALGDALVALLDQPEHARQLGERARAWVLANATWDRAAEILLQGMSDARRGGYQRSSARAELPGAAFAGR